MHYYQTISAWWARPGCTGQYSASPTQHHSSQSWQDIWRAWSRCSASSCSPPPDPPCHTGPARPSWSGQSCLGTLACSCLASRRTFWACGPLVLVGTVALCSSRYQIGWGHGPAIKYRVFHKERPKSFCLLNWTEGFLWPRTCGKILRWLGHFDIWLLN